MKRIKNLPLGAASPWAIVEREVHADPAGNREQRRAAKKLGMKRHDLETCACESCEDARAFDLDVGSAS